MRTTLTLDDDVLAAAKAIAAERGVTIGRALSDLVRQALEASPPSVATRNGVPRLPRRSDTRPVTLAMVNRLRDEFP
ncbi:CopG family transcriptional regulator [Caulobacter sp. LARHSG274]